jgi:hypothetical protein
MSGSRSQPKIEVSNTIAYPRNFAKPRSLLWFLQEIQDIAAKYDVKKIVVKGFEGRTRGKAYEERVEYESAVFIAAAKSGISGVFRKVKSTIAKDLGFKGRARYLQTSLNTSVIPTYARKSEKEKDAIVAAWSELR